MELCDLSSDNNILDNCGNILQSGHILDNSGNILQAGPKTYSQLDHAALPTSASESENVRDYDRLLKDFAHKIKYQPRDTQTEPSKRKKGLSTRTQDLLRRVAERSRSISKTREIVADRRKRQTLLQDCREIRSFSKAREILRISKSYSSSSGNYCARKITISPTKVTKGRSYIEQIINQLLIKL